MSEALASYLRSLGGEVLTSTPVESIDDLPRARAVLFDVTPRQLIRIAGHRLSGRYRRKLERYRYGAGVFKVDWALDGPVPWKAPECARAGTVHLGGTMEEIAASERAVAVGEHPEKPTFCSVSRAFSTHLGPQRASTPHGPTVMFQMGPPTT